MGANIMLALLILSVVIATCDAIECFQCGQYNDGVGSITPCIDDTHMALKQCPSKNQEFCIKYVSEGSTVRDCAAKCVEKDNWDQRTFCCQENGCNTSNRMFTTAQSISTLVVISIFLLII